MNLNPYHRYISSPEINLTSLITYMAVWYVWVHKHVPFLCDFTWAFMGFKPPVTLLSIPQIIRAGNKESTKAAHQKDRSNPLTYGP